MLLLAVVLFFVFVLPLCFYTGRRVAIVNARERRRRAFNRDQRIRELEYELGFSGERPQREWTDEPGRVIELTQALTEVREREEAKPRAIPAWYEAYRSSYARGYTNGQAAGESSDKLEVF